MSQGYYPNFSSRGDGKFTLSQIGKLGENVTFEEGVKIFNPENVEIGDNVYIGHNTIISGYHDQKLIIGSEVFISPNCVLYGSGGLEIRSKNGIGPGVMMLGSPHDLSKDDMGPINQLPLRYDPIVIEEGCDIGAGAIILGNVTVAKGTQIGAGAVVNRSTEPFSVYAGVPAKKLRDRKLVDGVEEYKWD